MRWADVDLETGWWTIPASVAKNALAHRLPLTKPVIEILERRRELAGESAKVVFENRRGAGSIAHRGKKAASILRRGLSFHFRTHDLRRTASTGMAEAGVPRDHIAKVLNHVEAVLPQPEPTTATRTTKRSETRSTDGRAAATGDR